MARRIFVYLGFSFFYCSAGETKGPKSNTKYPVRDVIVKKKNGKEEEKIHEECCAQERISI